MDWGDTSALGSDKHKVPISIGYRASTEKQITMNFYQSIRILVLSLEKN